MFWGSQGLALAGQVPDSPQPTPRKPQQVRRRLVGKTKAPYTPAEVVAAALEEPQAGGMEEEAEGEADSEPDPWDWNPMPFGGCAEKATRCRLCRSSRDYHMRGSLCNFCHKQMRLDVLQRRKSSELKDVSYRRWARRGL